MAGVIGLAVCLGFTAVHYGRRCVVAHWLSAYSCVLAWLVRTARREVSRVSLYCRIESRCPDVVGAHCETGVNTCVAVLSD